MLRLLGEVLVDVLLPATAVTVAVVMGGYRLVPWSGVRSVVSAPPRTSPPAPKGGSNPAAG